MNFDNVNHISQNLNNLKCFQRKGKQFSSKNYALKNEDKI